MQAFESACLSLAEFRHHSGFADARKSRKDVTDALKTVFWAFSLQERTGLGTAYGLERFFEPAAFGKNAKGDRFHNNKWSGYLAGRHEPKKVLIAVESKCPGANACLTSPLWEALTDRALTRPQLEALVLPLAPDIQSLVRRHGTAPPSVRFPGTKIDRGLAEALERRASLDALAATVILLRIAIVECETAAAYEWGRYALRIVLMLGELLHAGGIARPLLELLEERVLNLVGHDGARPGFPRGSFVVIARCFAEVLRQVGDQPFESMTEARRHTVGQRLFDVRSGFDCFYAFNPIRAIGKFAAGAEGEHAFATPDVWLHTWGLNMLSVGGHPDMPPPAVKAGLDLWAMGGRTHQPPMGLTSADPA